MKRRIILAGLSTLTILAIAAVSIVRPSGKVMGASDVRANELALRNRDIELYERRVSEDPSSSADLAQLAGLYMQRAREAGDYQDFRRAEAVARKSWSMRERRNGKALHMLASALLAQHKFAEARAATEQLVTLDPDIVSWQGLLAEIRLELGDYDAAAKSFQALETKREDLSVAPRLARWYEISGRNADARTLLHQARDIAIQRSDLPREQKAWFFLRTADHALRNGKRSEALRDARRGLEINPGDVRLISVMARVAYEREDWKKVSELVEPIVPKADIATLAMLGDAYANLNGHALADNIYRLIERRAAENPEPFNRQWTLYRLDHGVKLDSTVALLERESAARPDVLGYDMLAWGYYLTGRYQDAVQAMQKAQRMGTRDVRMERHAQLIAKALSQGARGVQGD